MKEITRQCFVPSGLLAVVEANQTYYLTPDHLGSNRVITDSNASVITRRDFYPFGESIDDPSIGGRNNIFGYFSSNDSIRQQFTGYEKDVESDLDFAKARYFGSGLGRFMSPDPVHGTITNPQSWNLYPYVFNNPIRFTDPDGRIAGDYYNQKGEFLGTDGKNDNKNYIVTNEKEEKQIKKTKGNIDASSVKSGVELPSLYVREEIGKAVDRSNSPTTDDLKGGSHEEGGSFGVNLQGKEQVVNAVSGAYKDVTNPGQAHIDPFKAANSSESSNIASPVGEFHIHPSAQVDKLDLINSTNGQLKGKLFNFAQEPSPRDIEIAGALDQVGIKTHIVVGARDKTVYFYNSSGTIAKFPLDKFLSIGKK